MPTIRTTLSAIAAICIALIAVAVYFQETRYMLPCPLCIIQRYAYLGIALFAGIGAATNRHLRLWTSLAIISAGAGIATVAKHLYVLAHPGFSCGIDPMETALNKVPTATLLPKLFRADGLCENATEAIMGLSVPQWSAVWFGILAVALVATLLRVRMKAA
ncbi:disulfide bond formation protein B [Massilia arenosa]|uniref:Disulfide bond formation protein B n=1 Tax=Zemynaea arenosa TaxID=2561931 RepID=A0A4Y9SRT5_9BURK|nr:disulfide bond formation protein B [Massilia arenosa]TFW29410.1 disulfide bond formation protein B [Massilia arenosa]